MKTIGIKLADGSFYPILEEGVPSSKTLDITTANDNQTTVLVDLYRSDDGTMDNAEYVDTLRIASLVPHPSGERTLSFNISLDENNRLAADIHDGESGGNSDMEITLSPRTEAQRESLQDDANSLTLGMDGNETQMLPSMAQDEALAVALAASGAAVESAAAAEAAIAADDGEREYSIDEDEIAAGSEDTDETVADEEVVSNAAVEDDVVPHDDLGIIGGGEIDFEDMVYATEADNTETEADAADFHNMDIEEVAEMPVAGTDDGGSANDDSSSAKDDSSSAADDDAFDDLDLPDIASEEGKANASSISDAGSTDSTSTADAQSAGTDDEADTSLSGLDLPDFDSDDFDIEDFDVKDGGTADKLDDDAKAEKDTASSGIAGLDELDFDLPDLDLPDFDSSGIAANGAGPDSTASDVAGLSLDDLLRDDGDDSIMGAGGAAMVRYGSPTIADNNSGSGEEGEERKTAVWPVVVCVACAVICVLAVSALMFVTLRTKAEHGSTLDTASAETSDRTADMADEGADVTVDVTQALPDANKAEASTASNKKAEQAAPQAKENEIVVAPAAEKVLPVKTEAKKADTKHTIQWGDTLWDISQSYYKTPWRYKYIAQYNHIKDPDYILSGTTILIPAQ